MTGVQTCALPIYTHTRRHQKPPALEKQPSCTTDLPPSPERAAEDHPESWRNADEDLKSLMGCHLNDDAKNAERTKAGEKPHTPPRPAPSPELHAELPHHQNQAKQQPEANPTITSAPPEPAPLTTTAGRSRTTGGYHQHHLQQKQSTDHLLPLPSPPRPARETKEKESARASFTTSPATRPEQRKEGKIGRAHV